MLGIGVAAADPPSATPATPMAWRCCGSRGRGRPSRSRRAGGCAPGSCARPPSRSSSWEPSSRSSMLKTSGSLLEEPVLPRSRHVVVLRGPPPKATVCEGARPPQERGQRSSGSLGSKPPSRDRGRASHRDADAPRSYNPVPCARSSRRWLSRSSSPSPSTESLSAEEPRRPRVLLLTHSAGYRARRRSARRDAVALARRGAAGPRRHRTLRGGAHQGLRRHQRREPRALRCRGVLHHGRAADSPARDARRSSTSCGTGAASSGSTPPPTPSTSGPRSGR